jgi:glycosyltransferase involved in cell wall biosynthesis
MSDEICKVSVVVPAYNAAGTLLETLVSVGRQTYRELEIIVVDDGSTDGTAAVVEAQQQVDGRIRLLRKANGGVASARNAGIAASLGEFVAFIDADDLWHPTKIAKQVAVLEAGGPEMGLVYTPYRVLDKQGFVTESSWNYAAQGWVLFRHSYVNLVGNGSSILARKSALLELGGYSLELREAGVEGCEDLLLQIRISARYRFGTVPEYLVGYRRYPGNMSSNMERMAKSGILAARMAYAECQNVPELSMHGLLDRYERLGIKAAVRRGQVGSLWSYLWREIRNEPLLLLASGAAKIVEALQRRLRQRLASHKATRRHFDDFEPTEAMQPAGNFLTRRAFTGLATLDAAYRPKVAYFSSSSRSAGPDSNGGGGPLQPQVRLSHQRCFERSHTFQGQYT